MKILFVLLLTATSTFGQASWSTCNTGGGGGGGTTYSFTAPIAVSGTNVYFMTNGLANNLFRQSAGLSVVGRSVNSTGDVADIIAGADGLFLARVGGTLVWTNTPSGSSTLCDGTLANYMLIFNGVCITNSVVQALTNGLSAPELDTGSMLVTNIGNGVVISFSHTLTNVLPTVGYLYYNGTNYSFSSSTTTLASGFYGGLTNADYLTTDTYGDVVFANGTDTNTMQTVTLTPGTWLVTANITWNTYRTSGQQLYVQLYNTETGAPVDKSERLVGPAVATAVYGEWPMQIQSLISVASTAVIKVQAHNAVPGDTQTQVRSAQSTLSWIKTN